MNIFAQKSKLITRRSFLKASAAGALTVSAGCIFDASLVEPRWVKVTFPVVKIAGLPPAWQGVRVAHWADIHPNNYFDKAYLEEIVRLTRDARPDILVMTGDIVMKNEPVITAAMTEMLSAVKPPEGKFASMGNHDPPILMRNICQNCGVELLVNQGRVLNRAGQTLCIAGVDDLWKGRPDATAALAGVDPDIPRVVLGHNPDYADKLPAALRVDLMLCGHTHGGQICLPLLGPILTGTKGRNHVQGLTRAATCQVYTTVGLGMVVVRARFNCRPELPILTLENA